MLRGNSFTGLASAGGYGGRIGRASRGKACSSASAGMAAEAMPAFGSFILREERICLFDAAGYKGEAILWARAIARGDRAECYPKDRHEQSTFVYSFSVTQSILTALLAGGGKTA